MRAKDCIEECLKKASECMKDAIILECQVDGDFTFDMVIQKLEIFSALEKQRNEKMRD